MPHPRATRYRRPERRGARGCRGRLGGVWHERAGCGVRRAAAEPLERLRHRRASAAASAFCSHIGAIFGGMVPPIVTLLAGYHHMGLASAMLAGIVVGAISFCLALLAGRETKGTRFDPDIVVD
jgi:VIT1/CCC1 family predicted Fe2+/Mn2+ transporter